MQSASGAGRDRDLGVTGRVVMATKAGITVNIPETPGAADSVAEDLAQRCPETEIEMGPPVRPVG